MSLAKDGKQSCVDGVGDLLKRARVFNLMNTEDGRNIPNPGRYKLSVTTLLSRVSYTKLSSEREREGVVRQ